MKITDEQKAKAKQHINAIVTALHRNDANQLEIALTNTKIFLKLFDQNYLVASEIKSLMRNSRTDLVSVFSQYPTMSIVVLELLVKHQTMLHGILLSLKPPHHISDQECGDKKPSFMERWEIMLNIKKLADAINKGDAEQIKELKLSSDNLHSCYKKNHNKPFFYHELNLICDTAKKNASYKIIIALTEFYKKASNKKTEYYALLEAAGSKNAKYC